MQLKDLNESYNFPSKYAIGDSIQITMSKSPAVDGWIRTVTFTNAKVRYSVLVDVDGNGSMTTLHNIDSVFISDGFRKPIEIDYMDNYS